jgi:HPt (histidine-containing phosphotransfer) domain-containing protein
MRNAGGGALDGCDRAPERPLVVSKGPLVPLNCEKLLVLFEDDPSTIRKLLDLFIREAQDDVADLVSACGVMDSVRIASLAHRLKGAACSIGAEPLGIEAAHLEALGHTGELAEAGDCIARLKTEFEAFRSYVADLMPTDLPQNAGSH